MESVQQRRTSILANHLVHGDEVKSVNMEIVETSQKEDVVLVNIDPSNGVALVTMNSPPVNALSNVLLGALQKTFQSLENNTAVKAIVLNGKGKFCGGADISLFTKSSREEMSEYIRANNRFLLNVENGSKPVVAAIDGFALGGGLEVAMSCHARVSTPTVSLGLPELNLGVIPGFGGTQRLPRLIGVQKAVEMMLTSVPIRGKQGKELGLIDELVSNSSDLVPTATKLALQLASQPSASWRRSLLLNDKVDKEFAKQVVGMARKQVARVAKNVPHPNAALNAVLEGLLTDGQRGLEKELEEFMNLIHTPTAQSLIHFFFASKQTSKVPGVTDQGLKPRDIKKAAVIGGGTMGSGIATALIMNGVRCHLKEVNQKFLDAGVERVKENVQRRVDAGKMTKEQYEKILSLLVPTLDYSGFKELDIVIEAVIENLDLKQKVFAEFERECNANCILATNTSTISVELIGSKTKFQNRIIGTHFFSPAHVMQLFEIIRTPQLSAQVIVDTLGLAAKLKKTPIVVGNCVGFTANRIFAPYCQAATFLAERGVDVYKIDKVIEDFGMPMGPFKMNDLSGLDVFAYVGGIIRDAYTDRVYRTTLVERMVKAGRLGQKTGSGFYKHEGRKAVPDTQAVNEFVQAARKDASVTQNIQVSDAEIVEMIFYTVVNESCRVLEENMVVRASDIDVCSVYGYGFPAYRGGIMKWGEHEGFKKIATKLAHWHKTYNHNLFKPSDYLLKLAK